MKKDFVGTLKEVAGMGYKGVELAGFGGMTAKELRQLCMEKIPQIQTKSGVHLITRKFDTKQFTEDWNMFAAEKQIIQPLPRGVIDGDWVHFSLYGIYLSKTQDFLKICKKHAKSVSTDKPCKNKTIVHATIDEWKVFHDDWVEYCKDTGFWLKCPDIHKDNPTVLFVP